MKINQPSDTATFSITDTVTFQGTASDKIVRVELWAEDKWHFGNSSVSNGNWSTSYRFTDDGKRQIEARGFDQDNYCVASDKIIVEIKTSSSSCEPRNKLFEIEGHSVWQIAGQTAFFYKSKMSVDADGAANAYHADDTGIDDLANAGYPGDCWGIVTDSNGNPVIQKASDPFPGYYISTTALVDGNFNERDPRRYVDATKIPYIVLPNNPLIWNTGVKKGDVAVVYYEKTKQLSFAIFADVGPENGLGEGSVKLAQNLGHDPFLNGKVRKGISQGVFCLVFPKSGNGKPRTVGEINSLTQPLFDKWGGKQRLDACFKVI